MAASSQETAANSAGAETATNTTTSNSGSASTPVRSSKVDGESSNSSNIVLEDKYSIPRSIVRTRGEQFQNNWIDVYITKI